MSWKRRWLLARRPELASGVHTVALRTIERWYAATGGAPKSGRTVSVPARILTREWRNYNDVSVVFRPARMTPERLREGYLRLWHEFGSSRGRGAVGRGADDPTLTSPSKSR